MPTVIFKTMNKLALLHLLSSSVGVTFSKSSPEPPTLYENFIENSQKNFSSCTIFPLGELLGAESDLEDYCSVAPTAQENWNSSLWLEQEKNRPSLLCYSLFMTVWTVCLQNESKVTVVIRILRE